MSEIEREHIRTKCFDNSAIEPMRHTLGDILATSSVRSLLRYKLISKLWRDLIRSQEFINLHLKYSNDNLKYIICRLASNYYGTELYLMNNYDEVTTILPLPELLQGVFLRVISSFDGLLFLTCVLDKNEWRVLTCNPATRKVHLIPSGTPSAVQPTFGIAYNCENRQYKVFKFFKDLLEPEQECYACEVYSPLTGSWRRIESVKYRPFLTPYSSCNDHICVDGTVYFLGCPKEDRRVPASPACIISVNMNDEKFKTINFPGGEKITQSSFLINLEGCLSLVIVDCPNLCLCCGCGPGLPDSPAQAHLWVAEDLEQSTWFHKTSFKIYAKGICSFKSVVARKSEILFIVVDEKKFLRCHIYNVAESRWIFLNLCPNVYTSSYWEWPVAFPFAESLFRCGAVDSSLSLISTESEIEERTDAESDEEGYSLEDNDAATSNLSCDSFETDQCN